MLYVTIYVYSSLAPTRSNSIHKQTGIQKLTKTIPILKGGHIENNQATMQFNGNNSFKLSTKQNQGYSRLQLGFVSISAATKPFTPGAFKTEETVIGVIYSRPYNSRLYEPRIASLLLDY